MRNYLLIFIGLGACVDTTNLIHKEGSVWRERNIEFLTCETHAMNEAPMDISFGTTPTWSSPITVQCSTYGNRTSCQQYGGQTFGGQMYERDANEELRNRVIEQCLIKKGFNIYEIPVCTPEQAKKAVNPSEQPPISQIACAAGPYAYVLKGS